MLCSGFSTLGYEPKPLDEIALEKTTDYLESYLEFKVLTNDVNSKDDVPCAWRTCYYLDGVKVRCGESVSYHNLTLPTISSVYLWW